MQPSTLQQIALRVSRYFATFLETDFRRQSLPSRRILIQAESGHRAGVRLSTYPTLDRDAWALLSRPSADAATITIRSRSHTRPISPTLKKVVNEQVRTISEMDLTAVRTAVQDEAVATVPGAKQNPEEWIEKIAATLAREVSTQVIKPLIANLDGPLRQQAYSVIDSLYAAESDLIALVAHSAHEALPDALAKIIAGAEPVVLVTALEHCLNLESTHAQLIAFFDSFVTADAFLEIRDIELYASNTEQIELCLYIAALKFNGQQYPILYVPAELKREQDGSAYTLSLINHIHVNRRAIDYVVSELAEAVGREWSSPIPDRIVYLAPDQAIFAEARALFRAVASAIDLGGQAEFGSHGLEASNTRVSISPALHLCAADRSMDSLLNDYEEIIDQAKRGGGAVVDLFRDLVGNVLLSNPKSIARAIDDQWQCMPVVDRVVFDSPIPLNEEQRKILLAVRNQEGRIIVVEGPPGTGKSHTITAIAADCAFNQRSCLILSDKREALDVVQRKLDEVMNQVRHDSNFPNPLLRLGQQNANFKRLTANQTLAQVRAYERAMRANEPKVKEDLQDASESLKAAITTTLDHLGNLPLQAVKEMHTDEADLELKAPSVLAACRDAHPTAEQVAELEAAMPTLHVVHDYLNVLFLEQDHTPKTLSMRLRLDSLLQEFCKDRDISAFALFERLDAGAVRLISQTVLSYKQLRQPLFGYLFRGGAVRALERNLNELPTMRPLMLRDDAGMLDALVPAANRLRGQLDAADIGYAFTAATERLARGSKPTGRAADAAKLMDLLTAINPKIVDALLTEPKDDPALWPLVVRFLGRWHTTRERFEKSPFIDYAGSKARLERLNTTLMNATVDSRLVRFMDENLSDAKTLASLVQSRQKFPESKFEILKDSFPVIIASIREFGEYMPLLPGLFDVVIIDEASQVSVAQALPAILRAKKIVVLGDSRQFSNVKAANASVVQNEKHRSQLVNFFESEVSREADILKRLSMFDVKKSILEFCSLAANYNVMLRKHFRSYSELIGYSSKTFYSGQLQAIKIRGVPIADVIRFDQIDPAASSATFTTNEAEGTFILAKLLELLEEEAPPTVGVITPFQEQQRYLAKLLFGHAMGRAFEDKCCFPRYSVAPFSSYSAPDNTCFPGLFGIGFGAAWVGPAPPPILRGVGRLTGRSDR
jgi:hypothetical protein